MFNSLHGHFHAVLVLSSTGILLESLVCMSVSFVLKRAINRGFKLDPPDFNTKYIKKLTLLLSVSFVLKRAMKMSFKLDPLLWCSEVMKV